MLNQTTSSFKEVILSIDTFLKSNLKSHASLKDYNYYSIGVDRNTPQFPYLVVYPVSESISRIYSSGLADVKRVVRFETKTLKPKQDLALNQSIGLTNNIRLLFSEKKKDAIWKFTNVENQQIVFNAQVSEVKTEDIIALNQGLQATSSVDITFFSQIDLTTYQQTDKDLSADIQLVNISNQKEIVKIIHKLLGDNSSILSTVRQFKYGVVEPLNFFPAVAVVSDLAGTEPTFPGMNVYVTYIKLHTYTSLMGGADAVYQNLDIIDKLRKIIFANKYIFNRCNDYSLDQVEFGIAMLGDSLLFSSIFNITVKSFDSVI